jgi:hypothetical protein
MNRLNIIRKLTTPEHWYHVPTKVNPADWLTKEFR